ncbi:MAG TPA: SRPBCC family protein [Rickettsiales bacterium]|nr:SRPBCC family protein [Rickettsiales bacterium]
MTANQNPNELRITRVYDAPVKAVWDAWTDPKQAAQWWGPRGFTITTHSKDLRPGGSWVYTMHGPDGINYPNSTKYFEVEPYSKLVYDHGGNEDQPPMFRVTVLFSEKKGKTTMDMCMALPSAEALKETKEIIKKASGNSTWDRLAEYLEKSSSGQEIFVINRTFDAPLETMFEMWTNPNHFTQWLAPTGFTMQFIRADIREGGNSFYAMTSNDGKMTMYGNVSYQEIKRPDRLVYTQRFSDENENVARHPMAPTWPETMRTTVLFAEEAPNQTRVSVLWEVVGDATTAEIETFRNGRTGMTQGWKGSFDKLEVYLISDSEIKVA